jgi:hypothetical protein
LHFPASQTLDPDCGIHQLGKLENGLLFWRSAGGFLIETIGAHGVLLVLVLLVLMVLLLMVYS